MPEKLPALKVVYTPLNGAGLECVMRILDKIGITDVAVVPTQREPDGNFSTCPYPNPEIHEALKKGIELCEQVQSDLLLATDPDCDRVGIAVKNDGEYVLLTGNEVGVLLLDFVCRIRTKAGMMPKKPVAVSTIVSTDMALKKAMATCQARMCVTKTVSMRPCSSARWRSSTKRRAKIWCRRWKNCTGNLGIIRMACTAFRLKDRPVLHICKILCGCCARNRPGR